MTKALFTGSFDPVTLGHIDIIRRAAMVFDEVIVCAMININKQYMFSEAERLSMLRDSLLDMPNVRVDSHNGFAADYAKKHGVNAFVKGVRTLADYEYEMQMAFYNKRIAPEIETVCLFAGDAYACVSSSGVRELMAFGGSVDGLVPEAVLRVIETNRGESNHEKR